MTFGNTLKKSWPTQKFILSKNNSFFNVNGAHMNTDIKVNKAINLQVINYK